MPDFRREGTSREQIDAEDARTVRHLQPWWRRFLQFCADVRTVAAICAATVATHAWVRGLVTTANVDAVVQHAVTVALVDVVADLQRCKEQTAGLQEWRGGLNAKIDSLEKRDQELDRKLTSLPLNPKRQKESIQ